MQLKLLLSVICMCDLFITKLFNKHNFDIYHIKVAYYRNNNFITTTKTLQQSKPYDG